MTRNRNEPFTVAVVQASPIFLHREATVDKTCGLIAEAGKKGARLVAFPECFIPTYPLWVWFIPAANTHALRELYAELVDNAVTVPSDTTERLCAAAKKANVTVVMGVNEANAEASGTTLYNTLLVIGPDGDLVGKHRKLIPTAGERLVHGQGDGSTLQVFQLPVGRLSALTCWENYMPLARYAMWAWGAQIHLAPTWDRGEPWISTLRHTAKEGRVYVLGCCSVMRRDDIPDRFSFKQEFLPDLEWLNPGDSCIVDPDGKFLVEPVREREDLLLTELDPTSMRGPRFQLDVAGHYARPDIFQLTLDRRLRPMLRLEEGEVLGDKVGR